MRMIMKKILMMAVMAFGLAAFATLQPTINSVSRTSDGWECKLGLYGTDDVLAGLNVDIEVIPFDLNGKNGTTITRQGVVISSPETVLKISSDSVDSGCTQIIVNITKINSSIPKAVQLWSGGPYWATCNLGATSPTDLGWCFEWGRTVAYKRNSGNTGWISVDNSASHTFCDKYCNCPSQILGLPDTLKGKGVLDASGHLTSSYDAATHYLGKGWRLPTWDEITKLLGLVGGYKQYDSNLKGYTISANGNSIFLPAIFGTPGASCGAKGNGWYLTSSGADGKSVDAGYWTCTPSDSNQGTSRIPRVGNTTMYLSASVDRGYGMLIRPVWDPNIK